MPIDSEEQSGLYRTIYFLIKQPILLWKKKILLYGIYCALVTFIFLLLFPLVTVMALVGRINRRELRQRLGLYGLESIQVGEGKKNIWIHAASVGEIQAAKALLDELSSRISGVRYIVSTMTHQGRLAAQRQLPNDVCCILAPLDIPFLVRRALNTIKPDLYICLETELWPAMLTETSQQGVTMALLNGRISEKSFRRYMVAKKLMSRLLAGFSGIATIHPDDKKRFGDLGARREIIQVTGNIKFDLHVSELKKDITAHRKLLNLADEQVFICGSTRTGEEEILAGVYQHLSRQWDGKLIWLVAPRHMKRIDEVREVLLKNNLPFDSFSELQAGAPRQCSVVLIDRMGVLASLYGVGDFNFCGGSLVKKGGHNIMEIIQWGKPAYFGPYMDDFRDAVDMVTPTGAGFKVQDQEELTQVILNHMQDDSRYKQACSAAQRVASNSREAAVRQADIVSELLAA